MASMGCPWQLQSPHVAEEMPMAPRNQPLCVVLAVSSPPCPYLPRTSAGQNSPCLHCAASRCSQTKKTGGTGAETPLLWSVCRKGKLKGGGIQQLMVMQSTEGHLRSPPPSHWLRVMRTQPLSCQAGIAPCIPCRRGCWLHRNQTNCTCTIFRARPLLKRCLMIPG